MQREGHVPGSPGDWLARAGSDLALARAPLPEGAVYEDLCFPAQQAAEKAIKAVYRARRHEFRYTRGDSRPLTGAWTPPPPGGIISTVHPRTDRRPVAYTLVLVACLPFLLGPSCASPADPPRAPAFALEDLDGRTVSLSRLAGKVVLINFWATWCLPCREEIPDLAALDRHYRDAGVVILGIALDSGSIQEVRAFAREFQMTYPVLLGDLATARDYEVDSLPTTVYVDHLGQIQGIYVGISSRRQIDAKLSRLLHAARDGSPTPDISPPVAPDASVEPGG